MLSDAPEGGVGGVEGGLRGRGDMYDYGRFAVVVGQKPIQHCKAVFLQLKNKFRKKDWNYRS